MSKELRMAFIVEENLAKYALIFIAQIIKNMALFDNIKYRNQLYFLSVLGNPYTYFMQIQGFFFVNSQSFRGL